MRLVLTLGVLVDCVLSAGCAPTFSVAAPVTLPVARSTGDLILDELRSGSLLTPNAVSLEPPQGIDQGQIVKTFQLGELYLGLVLRSSMNVVLDLPHEYVTTFSGVVVSTDGKTWQKYLEIKDREPTAKNNPYYLWTDKGALYLSVVDQLGAGSGEGNLKLERLDSNGSWELVDCYYFTYNGPLADGDYFAFSTRLDQLGMQPRSACENLEIIPV